MPASVAHEQHHWEAELEKEKQLAHHMMAYLDAGHRYVLIMMRQDM